MRNHIALVVIAPFGLAGCTVIPRSDPPVRPAAPVQPSPPAPVSAPVRPTPVPTAPLAYAALGQTVSVDGPRVTPIEVLEDSRCPINARCVWTGQVRLRIRVDLGSGSTTMEITSGKPIQVADGQLDLVAIRPDKHTGANSGAIDPSTYRFGFRFMGGL